MKFKVGDLVIINTKELKNKFIYKIVNTDYERNRCFVSSEDGVSCVFVDVKYLKINNKQLEFEF